MPTRYRRRSRSYLGSGSCGGGNAKNRRGKGGKGGWGRAGTHKHRWTHTTRYEPEFFGVHGFAPVSRKRIKILNLFELSQMISKGEIKEKDGKFLFEFDGKILGTGEITSPVVIKALSCSKKAADKIKAAGGEFKGAVAE